MGVQEAPQKEEAFWGLTLVLCWRGNGGREAVKWFLRVGLKAMGYNWLEPRGGSSWPLCEQGEVGSLVGGCCGGVKS